MVELPTGSAPSDTGPLVPSRPVEVDHFAPCAPPASSQPMRLRQGYDGVAIGWPMRPFPRSALPSGLTLASGTRRSATVSARQANYCFC